MISIVTFDPSARISSVADDSEGKAHGHGRCSAQEDDQTHVASGDP
jgi:hypothetical protein